MSEHEILDRIREEDGPIPELEPQIVKSRTLLSYYASVLIRHSEDAYLEFCMTWGLPVDWFVSNKDNPLEPNDVAFTEEGHRLMMQLTQEEWHKNTYAAELLKHLVKIGPRALSQELKRKLFELTKIDKITVNRNNWDENVTHIYVSGFFFSLLRSGFFTPEDSKKGQEIANSLAKKVIEAYYQASPLIRQGGEVKTQGVDKLLACVSPEVNREFLDMLGAVLGEPYRELNSRKTIDAINRLSDAEKREAIRKHGDDVARLLRSLGL